MREVPCPDCARQPAQAGLARGHRRRPVHRRRRGDADRRVRRLPARRSSCRAREQQIAERVLKEVNERLRFLLDVGLDYLSLDRAAGTLAGGEAQRIRLATQIGSGLVGVLYVLDEPSIGLHQRDNHRLIETLVRLRDLGNTLIVVEHDEDTIRTADWVVDIGPGAGEHGGQVVVSRHGRGPAGQPSDSLTGAVPLAGAGRSTMPGDPPPADAGSRADRRTGAREHNLRDVDGVVPAGLLRRGHRASAARASPRWSTTSSTAVLARELNGARTVPGPAPRGHRPRARRQGRPRRPEPDRAHPAVATRRPTPASSTTSASCSPRPPRRRSAATSRAGSRSTSRAAAARRAPATARSRSR